MLGMIEKFKTMLNGPDPKVENTEPKKTLGDVQYENSQNSMKRESTAFKLCGVGLVAIAAIAISQIVPGVTPEVGREIGMSMILGSTAVAGATLSFKLVNDLITKFKNKYEEQKHKKELNMVKNGKLTFDEMSYRL